MIAFPLQCRARKLPEPTPEYRFAPPRRWRLDFAWPERKLALEVEGGIWIRGRHSRGAGMSADMEKYAELAILGWRLLRVTPKQVSNGEAVNLVARALASDTTEAA